MPRCSKSYRHCVAKNKKLCPYHRSPGEIKIARMLNANKLKYRIEQSLPYLEGDKAPLRFDFAVVNKDGQIRWVIEYDGHFHYEGHAAQQTKEQFEKQARYDRRKDAFCQRTGLPLIRIPYWLEHQLTIDMLIPSTSDYVINV